MKNICFFNSNKVWGGGEKWHYEIALRLRAQGWGVFAITNRHSALARRFQDHNVPLRQIEISNLSFLNIFKILQIRKILKAQEIDAIFLNLPADVKVGGIAAKLAGVPKIIYRRGLAQPTRNTVLNRFLFKSVLTKVIAISAEVRRNILRQNPALIPQANIPIIYNGIDLEAYDHVPAMPIYKKKPDEIVLGNAGRLVEQKGQPFLIELAAMLKSRGIRFTLLIAGTGPLEAQLKQSARARNVAQEVVFVGFIERIKDFMESIDIFLLPSLYEGFGNVLLEAMAAQKPVIAFDLSSNPEVVVDGHTGFLAAPENLAAFAKCTEELIDNAPLRKQFGLNARQRAEEKFDMQRVTAEITKLIEE